MVKNNEILLKNRKILIDYIKKNSNATCKDIKNNTKIKVERLYNHLYEAYNDAGVKLPKNLCKRKILV